MGILLFAAAAGTKSGSLVGAIPKVCVVVSKLSTVITNRRPVPPPVVGIADRPEPMSEASDSDSSSGSSNDKRAPSSLLATLQAEAKQLLAQARAILEDE